MVGPLSGFDGLLNGGVRVAAVVWLTLASAAAADEAFVGSVLDCRSLSSAEERLLCYDGVVDEYSARDAERVADVPPATPDTDKTSEAEASFGLPPAADSRATVDRIEASVVELSRTASGKVVVVLDNGQVWRQTRTSTLRLAEGDDVEIRRRSMGSHQLLKTGSGRSMKVQRVR